MKKDKAQEAVEALPHEFELDELIERLIFIDKVERGLQQLEMGETKTHEEAVQIIRSWQR